MLPAIGLDGRYLDAHHPGIGRYVYELAAALPDALEGRQLFLLVRGDQEPARFDLAPLVERGVRLVRQTGPPRGIGGPLRIRRAARDLAVALWHAPFFPTSFGPACVRVLNVHDTIGVLDRTFLPALRRRLLYRLTMIAAVRGARRIITASEAARHDLQDRFGVDPGRIATIAHGVGDAFRPASADAVGRLRAELGLPERYLLFLGTDRPHKNVGRLVSAWKSLRRSGRASGWALVLAGYPRSAADDHSGASGIIHLGAVAEPVLPTLLSGASLFILPSLVEGFGLPVLEAMACGTAVACARAGSLGEVAGEAAAYFDPRDVDAMADTIGGLLSDPARCRALAEAGRRRAGSFTWRAAARATAAVYDQALARD